jgi:hypothetical protein
MDQYEAFKTQATEEYLMTWESAWLKWKKICQQPYVHCIHIYVYLYTYICVWIYAYIHMHMGWYAYTYMQSETEREEREKAHTNIIQVQC